ncbi:ABC transporter substrate-binding protein [Sinorhizobium meliloti]|uniref:ABC transporter substrate-binding protein n=1 Tax=Rhizobium meliloti TaxID=382 RepID=UPI00299D1853|nr:ABC transporter substrate-binding protein [Sinorhizobium meliloti]MDW9621912.1 ABC transporter substrate-binding protein [Sinorhizobium meliloti]MDX0160086.1 ABC transporter substrate-binding protein [Sinorhizobium meliloti]MDX0322097.1 ABC transporter substrate-binding protein [Sinorhizobium meliloti]MDX0328399.1 ABC transporter substrate-binding protein [Sinorhizobium meliloti]
MHIRSHRTSRSYEPRKLSLGLLLLGPVLALLSFIAPAYAQEVLRVPYVADIGTFDPDNGFEIGGMSAINNVYEGLVEYEPASTRIVGLLARNWEISDDGLIYTFHLAEGVKFHDGTPLNAAAVVNSFKRRRDRGLILSYFLANVKDIRAPDDSTVVLALDHAQPSFLDALASPWGPKVISPKALAQHDNGDFGTTWLNEHAVGTGPFKLAEFKHGEHYVLERNEDYWGDKPFFREVQISVVPDISQQILQLQAGAIDAVPINYPFSQLGSLPANIEATAAPSTTLFELFVRPGSPLDDADIRKAVLTAINPSLWAKDAFGRFATAARSPYPRIIIDPVHPVEFPIDFEAAKAAIAKHDEVSLVIGLHSAAPSYGRIADLLIAQLALIGVKATAYALPSGAAFAIKNAANPPDLLLTIVNPDAAHPENHAKVFFTKDAVLNFYGRVLAEADAIVEQAGGVIDVKKRNGLYEKAGRMYFDAGFVIPLVDVDDVVVHVKGLKDLGLRPVFPPGNIDFATVRRDP